MPVNTITVGAAVTPTVIETYISHYLNRGPLKQKPTAHISYHEGLELIRRFLHYASFHTVDELQAFTSQWVPVPHWVHVDELEIPATQLKQSAEYVRAQLGPDGIKAVGGTTWWEWRRDGNTTMKAEWIEMRKDMVERKKSLNVKGQRIMLYVHGGAYFFGSVDEHRYQMQRHARKLKARVLAPRYRLAPQFPFPCGLMDCLAAYLYLLEEKHDPATIILAGDSAGGGMVLSMLVLLRDQGIPLPAGAVLISPWVDLTHSFPSLAGDGKMDYIPAHGFIHKPSMSWPPPNADDLLALEQKNRSSQLESKKQDAKEEKKDRVRGFSLTDADKPDPKILHSNPETNGAANDVWVAEDEKYSIGPKSMLSLKLDGKRVEIKDQIQLYAPNHMLTHPMVSPALQPSLGGLPPLLIQVGGGELLRDEQIYIAHKAAQPLAYLPPPSNNLTAETITAQAARYRPTNVQLQLWDDLCHVAPTLSFTRPAKHMYRGIAQFGAWALARAQKTTIDIMDDESISIVSEDSMSTQEDDTLAADDIKLSMPQSAQHVGFESITTKDEKSERVGRAGDPLPPFENHMIRQRVDRHGRIYPLAPPSELEALHLPSAEIGVPKSGPVNKWMKAQQQWNGKFAKQKLKIQRRRKREMEKGYEGFEGETPPPTALAGRRLKGMKGEKKTKKSWGMALWSLWGSKHDEATIVREEKADQVPAQDTITPAAPSTQNNDPPTSPTTHPTQHSASQSANPAPTKRSPSGLNLRPARLSSRSRSPSHHSSVTDRGQISSTSLEDLARLAPPTPGMADATVLAPERSFSPLPTPVPTPGIVVSSSEDNPVHSLPQNQSTDVGADGSRGNLQQQQPPLTPTIIPDTETNTTRPFRGGVAYPFRLKVGAKEGGEVNASMATLVGGDEGEEVGGRGQDGGASRRSSVGAKATEAIEGARADADANGIGSETKRPPVERFMTAMEIGAGGEGKEKAAGEEARPGAQRPSMERFETAREVL